MSLGDEIIGVKFNVDVSNLKRGLQQANSYLNLTNSEFKKATAGMEDWQKEVGGVSAKLQKLKTDLNTQQSVVDAYRKKLDEVSNSTGDNTKQITYYTTKLNNAEAAVEKTKSEINKYDNALDELTGEQNQVTNSLDNMNDGFTITKGVIADLIADGIRNLITGLKDMAIEAFNTGVEFESAFAGVKKTVDATAEEYKVLEDQIINMSKTLPASASEIAKVAEIAGQLGIKKDDIIEFSKVMIDLGESTNLSSEEAATSLARLAGIMGTSTSDYSKLGSVIVELGNNYATTESEIVDMALRLAGAGETIGLSEAQVLSISAALSSVGIEAEMGGSAMSKAMSDMALAAETGEGKFADLATYAEVAGMSAKDFGDKMKNDAAGAITAFITGLGSVDDQGGSTLTVLQDLGFEEIRLRDTMLRTANASELFTGALKTGSKAWEKNNALTEEANKRYETTESKIAMMKNQISATGIEVYQKFQVPIGKAVSKVSGVFTNLQKEVGNGKLGKSIDKIAEAFGDFIEEASIFVSKWLKKLINGLSDLIDNWDKIEPVLKGATAGIIAFKVGMLASNVALVAAKGAMVAYTVAGTAFKVLSGAMTIAQLKQTAAVAAQAVANGTATATQIALNTAMSANPIGLVVTALAGLVALLVYFNKDTYEASDSQKELNKQLEEQATRFAEVTEEINANEEARKQLREEKEKALSENASEISYLQGLKDELGQLVDKNGKVKEGYEARVSFILNELNEALGTEMKLQDGVIGKYDEQMKKIDELIEKEHALAIWKAKETEYNEAIANEEERKTDWTNAYNKKVEAEGSKKEADKNLESALPALKSKAEDRKKGGYANGTDFEKLVSQIAFTEEGVYDEAATKKNIGFLGIGGWSSLKNEVQAVGEAMASQKTAATNLDTSIQELETANYALEESERIVGEAERDRADILAGNYKEVIERNASKLAATKDMNKQELKETTLFQTNQKQILEKAYEEALKSGDTYWIKRGKQRLDEQNKEINNTMEFLAQQTSTVEENSPEVIAAWANMANQSSEQFWDYVSKLNPELQSEILGMVEGIGENSPQFQEAMRLMSSGSYDKFYEYISKLSPDLQTQILSMQNGLTDKSPEIQEAFRLLSLGSYDAFDEHISKLTPDMKTELMGVLGQLEANDPTLIKYANELGLGIADGFDKESQAITSTDKVIDAVRKELYADNKKAAAEAGKLGDKIATNFDKSSDFRSVASNNIYGYASGIGDTNSPAYKYAMGRTDFLTSMIKNRMNLGFGIKSPSKVTAQMGAFLLQGLANGIKKNTKLAVEEAGLASEEVLGAFDLNSSLGQISSALSNDMNMAKSSLNSSLDIGGAIKGTNKIVNFTQNNYSPKPLSRLDIYRQSKNAVSVLEGV